MYDPSESWAEDQAVRWLLRLILLVVGAAAVAGVVCVIT